jgi:ankyrin repeat protein
MIASCYGLVPAVQAFVSAKHSQLHARDTQKRTALVWAAAYGHTDVAKVLVDRETRMFWEFGWLDTRKPIIIEEADHK